MEKLPTKLLFKIMMYLPLEDRLSCSLTCRRLAEVMTSAQLTDDIWLDLAGHEMGTMGSVLVHTQRQYSKLSLYEAKLWESNIEFWAEISSNLRVLELCECSWLNHVFYAILRRCTKLESLKIVNGYPRKIPIDDFVLPEGVCHEELRHSLSHLRHLHLEIILDAEILDLLLGAMPNVTSIYLSTKWRTERDFLERLPSILKKNGIISMGADFRDMILVSEKLIKFLEITPASLEDLRILDSSLTESACDAIVQCSRLRRLTVFESRGSFRGSHLKKLVLNSPDLETLKLQDVQALGDEDMEHLFELKKLHTLSLRGSNETRITTEFLCRLGELSTLVKLELRWLNVDSRVVRSLGCLQNLRSLTLDRCNAECFEAICENFKRLTELELDSVSDLTDADGKKLCSFRELRSLSFYNGHGFTDKTFERGVGSRTMECLRIGDCSLTDAGLMSIASHHDRLEVLTIYYCQNITEAGVLALLRHEPRLKKLELIGHAYSRWDWHTYPRDICRRLRVCSV